MTKTKENFVSDSQNKHVVFLPEKQTQKVCGNKYEN
jgi:hypothetical protein